MNSKGSNKFEYLLINTYTYETTFESELTLCGVVHEEPTHFIHFHECDRKKRFLLNAKLNQFKLIKR